MGGAEQQLEALARRYEHRVGFFASKVQRSFMLGSRWNDELVAAGYWGPFKALRNRRSEAHENELSAYVSQRIHGAVVDAARVCISQVLKREVAVGSPGEEERTGPAGEAHRPQPWFSPGQAQDPEELASRVWKQIAIREALNQLGDDDRRMIVAYMQGFSLSEIARDEGIATGTAHTRFRKLSQTLRARAPGLRRILLDREGV